MVKIAILGFGLQGLSAYKYWSKPGNQITICDQDEGLHAPEDTAQRLGPDYLKGLDAFDLLVRGPSVHPRDIVAANGPGILAKVTTSTNEFLRVCPTKKVIGVTGTKGKGTTSTLITKMLEATGKVVHLGGNIGIPPLDHLQEDIQPDQWVVLELANFQLIDLKYSPPLAACLMVIPEHLNWHEDMDEYITAKQQLFVHQTPKDTAIYFADSEVSHQVVSVSPGKKITYFAEPGAYVFDDHIVIDDQQICHVNELKLPGRHNWQNACAAATVVWQVQQDISAIRSVLTTFSGLEHRIELVRTVDGVGYYDDSFATTPEASIVALQSFTGPKVIVLGGSDKGATFDDLAAAVVAQDVRQVITVGDTGPVIGKALIDRGYTAITPGGSTMAEIVQAAHDAAKKGDIVLLSPGCASFGLFKSYKERGEQFKLAVGAL
jgi:UDP-N-acetylmuramoylalanine--D-glutamate ligase